MAKKVVALLGSPRPQSNSTALAQVFMKTAAELGAECQAFSLYKMKYSGCIACRGCKTTSEECVLRDDLTEALRAIRDADVLILASPVYFGQITGPLKCAYDRMYSFLPPTYVQPEGPRTRLAPGKHCVIILTQGSPNPEDHADVAKPYEHFCSPRWLGFQQTHIIRGLGLGAPGDAEANKELCQQVETLARQLLA